MDFCMKVSNILKNIVKFMTTVEKCEERGYQGEHAPQNIGNVTSRPHNKPEKKQHNTRNYTKTPKCLDKV